MSYIIKMLDIIAKSRQKSGQKIKNDSQSDTQKAKNDIQG